MHLPPLFKIPKRSTTRFRRFWKFVLISGKIFCSAVLPNISQNDIRPFFPVRRFDQNDVVDTGASLSCFASDYVKSFLQENKYPWRKLTVSVQTADISKHAAVDCTPTDMTFRGKTKPITFLIKPSFQQNLYFGIDFVRTFRLAKDLFYESFNTASPFSCNELTNIITDHHLSTGQAKMLSGVISVLFKELDTMVPLKIIEESQSPWSSL